jgi:hypothetical protein
VAGALLRITEQLLEALQSEGPLTPDQLAAALDLVDDPDHLLDQALHFLAGRSEILLDLGDRRVFSRDHVVRHLITVLESEGELDIGELASRSSLGLAVCCEALGWLDRDGRVAILSGNRVTLRDPGRR